MQAAQLSKKGDKLFLLTQSQLIALDMRETPAKPPFILWQTSISKSPSQEEITHIIVSDDDSTIYGTHEYSDGHLFHFDSQTGAKHLTCII